MTRTVFALVAVVLCAAWSPVEAAVCENGASAGFACSHVEFVGHLSPAELGGEGEVLNDVWGWVDSTTNEEYAIVGMQDGSAFVRIRTDGSLEFLGRLPASDGDANVDAVAGGMHKRCHDELCGEENSAWRDIKVFRDHAYIVSEAADHGLQIFDLTALRAVSGTPRTFETDTAQDYYGFYGGIGHAHNIFINESTARAYVVGHDGGTVAGGLHILDLSNDPMNPVHIGEVNGDGYTHDVQCVLYEGPDPDVAGSELCFASNEDSLTIWDVSGETDIEGKLLAKAVYADSGYTHQGWLSTDQRYFFLNDELDERDTGSRTHLRVFDVSDVNNPKLVADYFAPTLAIDHNNYVHGRWLYQTNYGAGLRILDVKDPRHPVEAAYFDTQSSDAAGFYGTWSNFAFPSGYVALSDVHDGLYVVRPVLQEGAAEPDLAVDLSLDDVETVIDEPVSGEIAVTVGPSVEAGDVLLTLHLPTGSVFSAMSAPSGWGCRDLDQGRVKECRGERLAAGAVQNFAFTLDPSMTGDIDVIAMAYANAADASPADNLDAVRLQVKGKTGVPVRRGGGGAVFWLLLTLSAIATAVAMTRRSRYAPGD